MKFSGISNKGMTYNNKSYLKLLPSKNFARAYTYK